MKLTKKKSETLSLEGIYRVLEILGIYDSHGKYFQKEKAQITGEGIKEILDLIHPEKLDKSEPYTRSIKNASKFIKEFNENLTIQKGKGLTLIEEKDKRNKNQDPLYQTLMILFLGLGRYYNSIHLEVFQQLLTLENPLGLITFLSTAIQKKIIIQFSYSSGRKEEIAFMKNMLPLRINFREGHWVLICRDEKSNRDIQFLLHSMTDIKSEIRDNQIQFSEKDNLFQIENYYKNSFGLSVFIDEKPITINLRVENDIVNQVKKRRKEGEWKKGEDYTIWTVITYSEDEVFDYIFRWNGKIKILSPKSSKLNFEKKLRKFL
ncbi:MAG: WYL domain-containing protein [Nanoarchaeota archaeon]|nr:WYL domain-containing protein [Nanoarchaeota archaeon]